MLDMAIDLPLDLVLGALPFVFLVLAGLAARRRGAGVRPWREAALLGAVVMGVWCVVGTEGLSQARMLSRWPIAAWWAIGCGAAGVVVVRRGLGIRAIVPDGEGSKPARDPLAIAYIALAAVIVVWSIALGAITPPNNSDTMAYHLPRQIYWLEQGSVEHFPATILRQITTPPFSEFVGVNLMAMTGSDALHNLVQGVAFALCVCGASLIARELGARARGQGFAALATASMPATLMQASTPKNDVLIGLWSLILLLYAVRVMRDGSWMRGEGEKRSWGLGLSCVVGATLGLSILTKGTGPIMAMPLCGAIGIAMLARAGRRAIAPGALMIVIACALNAGPWSRNLELYGRPMGPPDNEGGLGVTNESHAPALIASVFVRSVAQHMGTPWTGANDAIVEGVEAIHRAIGVEMNEPRVTYHASPPFVVEWRASNEDLCGAPAHLFLACVVCGWLVIATVKRRAPWWVLVSVAMPLVMFGAVCLLLKAQVWNTRLHIPVGCVLGAVSGAMIGTRKSASGWGRMPGTLIAVLICVVAAPSLLTNGRRALFGPVRVLEVPYQDRAYLGNGKVEGLRKHVDELVEAIREAKPRSIGVATGMSSAHEYLLLRALKRAGIGVPVMAFNAPYGTREPKDRPAPDVVVWVVYRGGALQDRASGEWYMMRRKFGVYTMLTPGVPDWDKDDPFPPQLVSIDDRFRGWTLVEGLGDAEGPYPKLELPSVRWGIGAETRVLVESIGRERQLVMTCRGNGSQGQGVEIWLGARLLSTHLFKDGKTFQTIRVSLGMVREQQELRIKYLGKPLIAQRDGRELSVLYTSLVVGRPIEQTSGRKDK